MRGCCPGWPATWSRTRPATALLPSRPASTPPARACICVSATAVRACRTTSGSGSSRPSTGRRPVRSRTADPAWGSPSCARLRVGMEVRCAARDARAAGAASRWTCRGPETAVPSGQIEDEDFRRTVAGQRHRVHARQRGPVALAHALAVDLDRSARYVNPRAAARRERQLSPLALFDQGQPETRVLRDLQALVPAVRRREQGEAAPRLLTIHGALAVRGGEAPPGRHDPDLPEVQGLRLVRG